MVFLQIMYLKHTSLA